MKAKGSSKAQTNKKNFMSDQAFVKLKNALEGARAFERGKRGDLNVTRMLVQRQRRNHGTR
jgi:hypothetical protein